MLCLQYFICLHFVSLTSAIKELNIVTGEGSRNLRLLEPQVPGTVHEVPGTFSSYYKRFLEPSPVIIRGSWNLLQLLCEVPGTFSSYHVRFLEPSPVIIRGSWNLLQLLCGVPGTFSSYYMRFLEPSPATM